MGRTFRILGTLGRGAFGEVHLTEIRTEDDFVQTLAVKWLHPEFSDDDELARRLRDEARLLGLLDHPNVVRVQGLTRLDGRLAVLMEAVRGRDLSGQHLPARAACQVGAAVAEALDAAWNMIPPGRDEPLRVVHRDIKPSNVMVTPHGAVKVMDFGVARATFEAREAQTRSQQYGTARYMAPERWLEGIAEGPSDVFSLGVTLIELVTGQPMPRPRLSRQGFAEDVAEALARVEPPNLRAELETMLAFAPADRPTATEVANRLGQLEVSGQDLRTWAGTLSLAPPAPSDATGTVVVEQTGDTIALTGTGELPIAVLAPTGSSPSPAPDPPRRTAWWAVGLGIALVGLVGFGVVESFRLGPGGVRDEPVGVPPAPEPVVEAAVPAPDPAPVEDPAPPPEPPPAPRPATTPRPPPAPVVRPPTPEVLPDPAPVEVPRVPVRFVVAEGLSARTGSGPLPRNGAALLPREQTARVEVEGPSGTFTCTLYIGSTTSTWNIDADGCRERH